MSGQETKRGREKGRRTRRKDSSRYERREGKVKKMGEEKRRREHTRGERREGRGVKRSEETKR